MNWIKEKSLIIGTYFVAFFTPVIPFMLLTGAVISLDYFLGIKAAKKRGEVICSQRRKDTITKGIAYQSALIIAHGCELLFEIPLLLKIVGGFVIYTEITSIDENYKTIYGKSLFKIILDRFPKMNSNEK